MEDESKYGLSPGILEVHTQEEDREKTRKNTTVLHCYYASCLEECKMKVKWQRLDEKELSRVSMSVEDTRNTISMQKQSSLSNVILNKKKNLPSS